MLFFLSNNDKDKRGKDLIFSYFSIQFIFFAIFFEQIIVKYLKELVMKAVLQRVGNAELRVEGKVISKIGKGLVVYFGVEKGDSEAETKKIVQKIVAMRIFEDQNGKMNLSIKDVEGQVLLVSQFTLLADCSKGNRPNFLQAEMPDKANQLYLKAKTFFEEENVDVQTGVFGADMKISQLNDGPVTIVLDSKIFKI